MTTNRKLRAYLYGTATPLAFGMLSLAATGAAAAPCVGPGAPTTTQTKCVTAITIPGNPLQSYDISWVNPDRAAYYLADRSNFGITIIDTQHLRWKRTIPGFVGVKFNATGTAADNAHSGPNGVVSHGRWLYAGDGDSTLKVVDLDAPTASAIKQIIPTGGTTRANEMALSTDGRLLLLGMNTPENPPFATLYAANGDAGVSNVVRIARITVIPRSCRRSLAHSSSRAGTPRPSASMPRSRSSRPIRQAAISTRLSGR